MTLLSRTPELLHANIFTEERSKKTLRTCDISRRTHKYVFLAGRYYIFILLYDPWPSKMRSFFIFLGGSSHTILCKQVTNYFFLFSSLILFFDHEFWAFIDLKIIIHMGGVTRLWSSMELSMILTHPTKVTSSPTNWGIDGQSTSTGTSTFLGFPISPRIQPIFWIVIVAWLVLIHFSHLNQFCTLSFSFAKNLEEVSYKQSI